MNRHRIRRLRETMQRLLTLRPALEVTVEDTALGIRYPLRFEGRDAIIALMTDWRVVSEIDAPLFIEPASPGELSDYMHDYLTRNYGQRDSSTSFARH